MELRIQLKSRKPLFYDENQSPQWSWFLLRKCNVLCLHVQRVSLPPVVCLIYDYFAFAGRSSWIITSQPLSSLTLPRHYYYYYALRTITPSPLSFSEHTTPHQIVNFCFNILLKSSSAMSHVFLVILGHIGLSWFFTVGVLYFTHPLKAQCHGPSSVFHIFLCCL